MSIHDVAKSSISSFVIHRLRKNMFNTRNCFANEIDENSIEIYQRRLGFGIEITNAKEIFYLLRGK